MNYYETTTDTDTDSGSGSDFYGADPDYIDDYKRLYGGSATDIDLDYVFVYTWIFFMMNMLF